MSHGGIHENVGVGILKWISGCGPLQQTIVEWYKRVLEAGGTSTRQKIAGPATKDRLPRVAGKWMATGAAMADK